MLTCTSPMLIWPRPLKLSAETAIEESWQSMDAPRSSSPLSKDGLLARVQDNRGISQSFLSQTEWSKDVSLPPPPPHPFHSIMFSAMLMDAFRDTNFGIGISYCMNGSVFNLRRLQAKTKVTSDTVNDFLFVDDCTLNTASEADMHYSVEKLAEACNNFGLTISIKKTEVMHQPTSGKTYTEPHITSNGQQLKAVDKFTYLGSTHLKKVVTNDEVNADLLKQVLLLADSTRMCGKEEASP